MAEAFRSSAYQAAGYKCAPGIPEGSRAARWSRISLTSASAEGVAKPHKPCLAHVARIWSVVAN